MDETTSPNALLDHLLDDLENAAYNTYREEEGSVWRGRFDALRLSTRTSIHELFTQQAVASVRR